MEWGPWIEHDGKGLPDHVRGQWIQAEGETASGLKISGEGREPEQIPENWDWFFFRKPIETKALGIVLAARILRYRIRRPPEAKKLIETIRRLPVKEAS